MLSFEVNKDVYISVESNYVYSSSGAESVMHFPSGQLLRLFFLGGESLFECRSVLSG